MSDLDLTVPDAVLCDAAALRQDSFTIRRATSSTVSGVTTPGTPQTLGPYFGEFWALRGSELAPSIAEARGSYRLAVDLDLVLEEADQIVVGGVVYSIVWLPPPSGLDITRIVGLAE